MNYNHERDTQPDIKLLRKIYEIKLNHHFTKIQEMMDVDLTDLKQKVYKITNALKQKRRITEVKDNKDIYHLYILIKGLLHRLDHAASAHVDIEVDTDVDIAAL